jgi:probable phosphoglycerate mutase
MIIYIFRHGQTEFNRLGIVQGSGVDSDLNETGRAQARAFYEHYQTVDFQMVVTSKLRRTHQTSAHFIEAGIPWHQDADINEISWGDHEGLSSTPELMAVYEHVVTNWINNNLDVGLPNGETARQLGARLERFIAWLRTRPADRVLVCTHGRTIRALITLLKGWPLSKMEDVEHQNTGCFILKLENDQFHFVAENSVQHLGA